MALYQVGLDHQLTEIEASSFKKLNIQERKDLQVMLRNSSEKVFPDLLVFSEEFGDWQESSRRIDLLALDKDANLVVIELKVEENGSHMELQAIRYAAMISIMNFSDVVNAYEQFLSKYADIAEKRGHNPANAREYIRSFLIRNNDMSDEIEISNVPKIMLLSPSFSKEITTTVMWLINQGLDIRCYEVKPYEIETKTYLDIEQVIPLPTAEEFIVKLREKNIKTDEIVTANKRRARTIPLLVERGYLKENDRLYLVKMPKNGMIINDDSAKKATFIDTKSFKWDYDGQIYSSLGQLCEVIYEKFVGESGPVTYQGPNYWAKEGDNVSLWIKSNELDS